jgi:hypothetical protein
VTTVRAVDEAQQGDSKARIPLHMQGIGVKWFREEFGEVVGRLGRVGGGDRRCGGINGVKFDASRGRSHVRVRGVHHFFSDCCHC